jgi:hypothetical protein
MLLECDAFHCAMQTAAASQRSVSSLSMYRNAVQLYRVVVILCGEAAMSNRAGPRYWSGTGVQPAR